MKTSALAAKEIRNILKVKFPETKFSVRSDSFSMGDSVNVSYTDGPTTDAVESEISQYQYGHFNSMEDIYEISNNRSDIPQTKYLSVDREMSEEMKTKLVHYIQGNYSACEGKEYGDYISEWNERFSTLVYRHFVKYDCRFINFEIDLLS
jgi:hypothetical protein